MNEQIIEFQFQTDESLITSMSASFGVSQDRYDQLVDIYWEDASKFYGWHEDLRNLVEKAAPTTAGDIMVIGYIIGLAKAGAM